MDECNLLPRNPTGDELFPNVVVDGKGRLLRSGFRVNGSLQREAPGCPCLSRRSCRSAPPCPLGVDRSQNTSCVSFSVCPSCQMRWMLLTHRLTLLFGSSGRSGLITRWSRPSLRPSEVIFQHIVLRGSNRAGMYLGGAFGQLLHHLLLQRRGLCDLGVIDGSGRGRFSWSAVLMSAASRNRFISSGRLKNLEKRVRAR